MKKNYLLLIAVLLLSGSVILGQAPQKIDFQAMARDGSGNPLLHQNIGVRISVIQGSTTVYTERHTLQTDDYGLFNLHIGDGTPLSGNFSSIDWSLGNHKVKVEIDPNGGYVYLNMGTSILTSSPYAFYGKDEDDNPINELQSLSINGNDLTISDGNTVTLPAGGGSTLWEQNGNNIYYDAGDVGNGTSTPDADLHVDDRIRVGEDPNYSTVYGELSHEGGGNGFKINANAGGGGWADIHLQTNGTTKVFIESAGNVGIGTTSPEAKLEVNGTTKLGSSGALISEMREITGTTSSIGMLTIVYPMGYTKSNTRVLSLEIYYNNLTWRSMGSSQSSTPGVNVSCGLGTGLITINYPDVNEYHNKPFRMILMKME